MRFYLAARYIRREEMLRYAALICVENGWEPCCRWINGHEVQGVDPEEEKRILAEEDFEDLAASDVLIHFSSLNDASRGGNLVELGIALGMFRRVIVVGPRVNVFHYLPQVEHYETWEEFLCSLK